MFLCCSAIEKRVFEGAALRGKVDRKKVGRHGLQTGGILQEKIENNGGKNR